MTRILHQPVHIEEAPDGSPRVIYWLTGRERIVSCLECWVEVGEWWLEEAPKRFYRVATDRNRVYEMYRELPPYDTPRPEQRYAERESAQGSSSRPADTKHLADFHLSLGNASCEDSPFLRRKTSPPPLPTEHRRYRWILYKALD